jgi:chromate transporter
MISEVLQLLVLSMVISISTFGGGSQALFYQYAVLENRWITTEDLSAVLAFGYATPGPAVFGTSTFIGYHLAGIPGAIIGTIGIFIIPFISAFMAAKYLSRFLMNPHVRQFLKGVGLAATGLVAATTFRIFDYGTAQLWQLAIAVIALAVSVKWRPNPVYLLLAGLCIGLLLK